MRTRWDTASRRLRLGAATTAAGLALAAPGAAAQAPAPIMPLDQVRPGMACSVASVVRGTEITRFGAEVVDVVDGSVTGLGPKILVRVSGAVVEGTGIGPGFSGSPVLCAGSDGVERIAGAISHGVGDTTNRMALVAPIERVLGRRVSVRAGARASRLPLRDVRALTVLSLSGVDERVAAVADRSAQRTGRRVLAVPAAPAQAFGPVDLQPGSAMAVGLSSGDVALNAIGTVTYRDGNRIWGFGHELDRAGRRALLLQDAYVYGVLDAPGFIGGSPKFAAPGRTLGTLTHDRPDAVAGTLGAAPPTVPMTVLARDADNGTRTTTAVEVPDESALDEPLGASPLRLAGSFALADRVFSALDGTPARVTARMCARIRIEGERRPLGFCNRYVVDGAAPAGSGPVGFLFTPKLVDFTTTDLDEALGLLDTNTFARLRPASVRVELSVRRGLRQAFLVGARGPREVRAGRVLRVRARVRSFRGEARTVVMRVPVPRRTPPGRYELTLTGTPADTAQQGEGFHEVLAGGFGAEDEDGPSPEGPGSMEELRARVAMLERPDGVTASLVRAGRRSRSGPGGGDGEPVYLSPRERISGSASLTVRVARR